MIATAQVHKDTKMNGDQNKRFAGLDVGENRISLADLVRRFNKGTLSIPYFQREYVWSKAKGREFAKTIMSGRRLRLGVYMSYQVPDDDGVYLCDGLQRLTTVRRFIHKPSEFGIAISTDDAVAICEDFYVTLQHNHLESHEEGLWVFQVVNLGTAIVPAEYYKGELTRSPQGAMVWQQAPKTVNDLIRGICTTEHARNQRHTTYRDSLALFYQYATQSTEMEFWRVAASSIMPDKDVRVIERVLAQYVNKKTENEITADLRHFAAFLETQVGSIAHLYQKTGFPRQMRINSTLLRWMLHTSIWRRNTDGALESDQIDLFSRLLAEMYERYGSTVSKIEIVMPDGQIRQVGFSIGRISGSLGAVCAAFGNPLYEAQGRKGRRK